MALKDRPILQYVNDARKRLLADPQDDLRDIVVALENEIINAKKQWRMRVLWALIVEGLFGSDIKSARRALAKCYTLKPDRQADSAEAARLLQVVWGRCIHSYKEDVAELVKELDKTIEFTEEFQRNGFVER